MGGHSHPRTHRAVIKGRPMNVGLKIVLSVLDQVKKLPNVEILNNARVVELLQNDRHQVSGVKFLNGTEEVSLEADAVILTTGGFSTDRKGLLSEFKPEYRHLPSTNGPWKSVGDGIRMGRRLNAKLTLMEHVQIHPTGLVDPNNVESTFVILAGEALRGNGGLLFNLKGERFVNELDYRDVVSKAIQTQGSEIELPNGKKTPKAAFLVLNDESVNKFKEAIMFYKFKKLVFEYANLKEFCEEQKMDYETVLIDLVCLLCRKHYF
jgi:aspartate oxidase